VNNDEFGDYCQDIIADYYLNHLNAFVKSKGTCGHDLILYLPPNNDELKIEVKGLSQLFKNNSKDNIILKLNRFKFDLGYLKADTTHYAFVIQDSDLIPKPIFYILPAIKINNLLKLKNPKNYYNLPISWLRVNFTPINIKSYSSEACLEAPIQAEANEEQDRLRLSV
jgi:hypothetical protein